MLNGRRKGKNQRDISLTLKKNGARKNYGIGLNRQTVIITYDIDSIMNEQVEFYSKLFQSEGWDENSAHELTRYIVNKLGNNEKETLDEDISLDEISRVIRILKPNKSPGEDGIISEFYQLFWQDIKNGFFSLK